MLDRRYNIRIAGAAAFRSPVFAESFPLLVNSFTLFRLFCGIICTEKAATLDFSGVAAIFVTN